MGNKLYKQSPFLYSHDNNKEMQDTFLVNRITMSLKTTSYTMTTHSKQSDTFHHLTKFTAAAWVKVHDDVFNLSEYSPWSAGALKFFADFPNTFKTATRCNSFAVIDELISEEKKIISFQLSQNICHLLKLKHNQSLKKVFLWIYKVMSGMLTYIITPTGHLLDIAKNATNRQQQKVESVQSWNISEFWEFSPISLKHKK